VNLSKCLTTSVLPINNTINKTAYLFMNKNEEENAFYKDMIYERQI